MRNVTGHRATVEECPVCSSDAVEYWEEFDSWICDSCSYAFDDAQTASEVDLPSEGAAHDRSSEGSSAKDWTEAISVKDNSEAILVEVLSQTEDIAEEVGSSEDVSIRAAEIIVDAWESNFMHGRTKDDTVAAAFYTATREAECSVPPGVLAMAVGTEKRKVKSTYTQLKDEQELGLTPPTPEEYISYICDELELPDGVKEESEDLLEKDLPRGGNPIGIAAGGVYKSANKKNIAITLREVADVVNLTKETVWRHGSQF